MFEKKCDVHSFKHSRKKNSLLIFLFSIEKNQKAEFKNIIIIIYYIILFEN